MIVVIPYRASGPDSGSAKSLGFDPDSTTGCTSLVLSMSLGAIVQSILGLILKAPASWASALSKRLMN
jgi:hypothetical protein